MLRLHAMCVHVCCPAWKAENVANKEGTLLKSLNVTLGAVAIFWCIEIPLHDDEFTPPWALSFI
jgi:hypothetical protein